jgi:hypothetical protein
VIKDQARGLSVARTGRVGRLSLRRPYPVAAVHAGASGLIRPLPADSFMSKWYCNPVRLTSQSERLPS